MLEHLMGFHFLNYSGIPKKYITLYQKYSKTTKQGLLNYINTKYQTEITDIEQLGQYDAVIRKKFIQCVKTHPKNSYERKLKNIWHYCSDCISRLKNHQGQTITFSGVDGAGKSTILHFIKTILVDKYRQKVVVLRHRPSILPILSAWRHGKAKASEIAATRLPRQGQNRSKISSVFRFLYYYFDFLIGQGWIFFKYNLRGIHVLYDRYYFDFIIDSKRSNIDLPQWLLKGGYKSIHHPNLNFLLYAQPEIILQRKKELSYQDIQELTHNYKTLFEELDQSSNKQYKCIDNQDLSDSLSIITRQFILSQN